MLQTELKNFVDQSAASLIHSLVEGDLELQQFHVLQTGSIVSDSGDFKLTGRIIGASHLLTIELNSNRFHEIFACSNYHTSANKIVSSGPLNSLHANMELKLWDRISYQFRSNLFHNQPGAETWLANLEKKAAESAESGAQNSFGLIYHFPADWNSAETPKTVVLGEGDFSQNQVRITTAHSYPNEKNIVQSETILKFI